VAVGNATVVRLRREAPTHDRYGDPSDDEPARLTIEGASVYPRSSADVDERGRSGVIVGLTLIAPYGTDLQHIDQVEVDGVLYDLDGDPGQWKHHHTGWEAGLEVALKRAAG